MVVNANKTYAAGLDFFYSQAPFRLIDVEVKKQGQKCECCGNYRLKRLAVITDKQGRTWRIGFECWKNIEDRQFSDPTCSFKQLCCNSEDKAG